MPGLYRFRVTGRVQGVFFRQSTLEQALRLGVTGWVMNTDDGAVEGLAAGDETALAALREWLGRGPPAAAVDAVQWTAAEQETPSARFVIRR